MEVCTGTVARGGEGEGWGRAGQRRAHDLVMDSLADVEE